MREATRIQSAASSSRLGGIRVSDAEVAGLLRNEAVPLRDTPEILGYAAALEEELPVGRLLETSDLRRLNALLLHGPSATLEPTPWRQAPLEREAFDAHGHAMGRVFSTLPPHLVEEKTEQLVSWLEIELRSGDRHPILVIATFSLALLGASPFERGSGRISRLLLGLLLRRAGYAYLPYASIERQFEEAREAYYDAFDHSNGRLWNGDGDLEPWLRFVLDCLLRQRQRVEVKVDLEREALNFPPLQQVILETVREHGTVDAGILLKATGANRNTLKDNLRKLVDRGILERTGERRGSRYRLAIGERAMPAHPE
ncbi:MAG TPA: hypothetical protein VJS92_17935 [Candidatus Polarisedimenticolaceae bacterium]|nr:hypothetical protein [Candidatus Polarisedimenticolaceae bacterium]